MWGSHQKRHAGEPPSASAEGEKISSEGAQKSGSATSAACAQPDAAAKLHDRIAMLQGDLSAKHSEITDMQVGALPLQTVFLVNWI